MAITFIDHIIFTNHLETQGMDIMAFADSPEDNCYASLYY